MPRTGRPRKPTNLLKLTGAFRADRHGGRLDAAVGVDPELPDCPAWLGRAAQAHWPEIGAMLAGLGILGQPHAVSLALLCDALADWIHWSTAAESPHADPKVYDHKAKAWERTLKACREFGMTPSAITGLRSAKPDEEKTSEFPALGIAG